MYKIALVLDEAFGARLFELARICYVWIIESEVNLPWIKRVWKFPDDEDPLSRGATSFARYPGEGDEEILLRVLDMLDEHHGEGAHEPPWSEIEVHGAALSPDVLAIMQEEYGVDRFEKMPDGFCVYRKEPNAVPSSSPPKMAP